MFRRVVPFASVFVFFFGGGDFPASGAKFPLPGFFGLGGLRVVTSPGWGREGLF